MLPRAGENPPGEEQDSHTIRRVSLPRSFPEGDWVLSKKLQSWPRGIPPVLEHGQTMASRGEDGTGPRYRSTSEPWQIPPAHRCFAAQPPFLLQVIDPHRARKRWSVSDQLHHFVLNATVYVVWPCDQEWRRYWREMPLSDTSRLPDREHWQSTEGN